MPYTSITNDDAKLLELCLESACANGALRFLEIGILNGDTSREVKSWCDQKGTKLDFWGIDSGTHPDFRAGHKPVPPFDGANLIIGDSAEVFWLVPFGLDVVFVDGCHCVNHVMLDLLHYSPKVRSGGFLLLHDTAPHIQQTMKDPHGPDIPEFHNSVLIAIELLGWPRPGWSLKDESRDGSAPWGGVLAYQKA